MPSVVINVAAAATTPLVAAPGAGKWIRVLGYVLYAGGTVNATLKSAGNALTGPFPLKDQGRVQAPETPDGWFDCNQNEALNLVTDAASQVSGHLKYQVYPQG